MFRIMGPPIAAVLAPLIACAAPSGEPRSMQYTPRPAGEARAWQSEVRAKLFTLLAMDDLLDGEPPALNPEVVGEGPT